MAEKIKDWDGQLMAVVSPESFPNHLRGVFLTRSAERAEKRSRMINGMVFRPVDMDEMAEKLAAQDRAQAEAEKDKPQP